eukprot:TRINITY_DN8363_c0_g1_i1.p1 TRINITY_DN8363_c0_g1~~TRINITY_DN8363_c0_g1_i1.p1  ORF type:complete len:101 (+),score=29.35 TRINITY_DN8363_c0_g1_i1:120-422(+)
MIIHIEYCLSCSSYIGHYQNISNFIRDNFNDKIANVIGNQTIPRNKTFEISIYQLDKQILLFSKKKLKRFPSKKEIYQIINQFLIDETIPILNPSPCTFI